MVYTSKPFGTEDTKWVQLFKVQYQKHLFIVNMNEFESHKRKINSFNQLEQKGYIKRQDGQKLILR